MKTIEVTGTKRVGLGKTANKKTRREDKVPATVYGHGNPENVSLDMQSVRKAIYTPEAYIVNLNIDGATVSTIIRETQFHPVTDNLLHVDFLRLDDAHEIEVDLPIRLVGTSKGVLAGGKLVPLLRRIKVKGLASKLPDAVEVDISNLDLGKTIRVNELPDSGVTITSPGGAGIAIIDVPRAVKTAN
jgi:large subunit ribosomal protein L25